MLRERLNLCTELETVDDILHILAEAIKIQAKILLQLLPVRA